MTCGGNGDRVLLKDLQSGGNGELWRCVGMTNWTNSPSGMSVAAVKRESGCHLSASTIPRQICRKRHGTNMRTLWHRPGSPPSLSLFPQAEMGSLFVSREQDNCP